MSSKKVKTMNDASSSHCGGESVIAADYGRRRSTCGYCKSTTRSRFSHGFSAETLTVNDYQDLIDRGWRRSGCYLYTQEMEKTCCPAYTIRLKASDYVPSKEQQRVSRKLERFLDGKVDMQQTEHTGASSSSREVSDSARSEESKVEPIIDDLCKIIDQAVQKCQQSGKFPSDIQIPKASVKKKVFSTKRLKLAEERPEQLLYTSNIAFTIAAAIKRIHSSEKEEMKENRLLSPETISEMLMSEAGEIPLMKVCKGHINVLSAFRDVVPNKNISRGVSSMGEEDKTLHQARKRKLEIHLRRSSFDTEEHELYKRYQMIVHKDKPEHVAESAYRRFLVDSPLIYLQPSSGNNENVPPCGFGSFHQQYRVDGRLIAVGVVDILPKCLSSVYLFWDPDYAFLSLGKYSAMQEINWVKENQVQYYYLGYYIHSCNKMRYKAAYRPSELLCPLRFKWVPYEVAKPLLDKKPYVILSDIDISQNQCSLVESTTSELEEDMEHEHVGLSDEDDEMESQDSHNDSDSGSKDNDIDNIRIGLYGIQYRYKDLRLMITDAGRKQLEPMLQNYRKVVGDELSERMLYGIR